MKFYDDIGSFIIELVKYADDKDIKTFLQNCFEEVITQQDREEELLTSNYYMQMLLNYLYNYICLSDETLERLPTFKLDNADFDRLKHLDITKCRLIYMHLVALCQSYYTLWVLCTPQSCTKILKLLIENYKINKFYYYIYNEKLIRIKIKQHGETKYYYDKKEFYFERDSSKDYILSENRDYKVEINKNFAINTILQQSKKDAIDIEKAIAKYKDDFFKAIKEFLIQFDFQDIKEAHEQIVSILKNEEKEYCKCCNPNRKNPKATKLCDKCKNLFDSLEELKTYIDDWESNDFICSITETDFKKMIYEISPAKYPKINKLRNARKNKLNKLIQKLETEIEHSANSAKYEEITKCIAKIKQQIIRCFDN